MRINTLCLALGIAVAGHAAAQTTTAAPAATDTSATQAVGAAPAAPSPALGEEQIKQHIAAAGYREVKGLEFDHGVWRTKARGGNDHWVRLTVGAVSGKVYPEDAPSALNENEVEAKLAAAGYQRISHVRFDDGLWLASAVNARGARVKLLVDPGDGSVVASEAR